MKHYKLTTQHNTTFGNFHWFVGQWYHATGPINRRLCTDSWLHCYDSPYLAVLLNPVHANISEPKLWLVETKGRSLNDKGLKRGYRHMKLVRQLALPELTPGHRTKFAILCAQQVCDDPAWRAWAQNWLSGADRTESAARAALKAIRLHGAPADVARRSITAAIYAGAHDAAYTAMDAVHAASKKINLVQLATLAVQGLNS